MFRVSYSSDNEGRERWSLCGRLAGPWVEELRACWRKTRSQHQRAQAVVDIKDVTFIDEAGEELLAEMQTAGSEFVAGGVENKYVLAGLQKNGRQPPRLAPREGAD